MRFLLLIGIICQSIIYADRCLSPEFLTRMFPKPQEELKEYFLDSSSFEMFKQIPFTLKPYAAARLGLVQMDKSSKILSRQKVFQEFKSRKDVFPTRKKLTTWMKYEPSRIKLSFFIKYKGVKQTKDEKPHLLLNYRAREGEIAEGFEASENLKTTFKITQHQKIISYIGVFEKWVNHRKDYDSSYFLTMDHPDVAKDIKVTGTVKYALGWNFEKPLTKEKKLLVDLLMQHTANNQWKYKDRSFIERKVSKAGFDHWIVRTGLHF
jgi:hypothetical protein